MEPAAKRSRTEIDYEEEEDREVEEGYQETQPQQQQQQQQQQHQQTYLSSLMSMVQQCKNDSTTTTEAASAANDEMRPIDATGVNVDALQFLHALISEPPPGLVMSKSRHHESFWRVMATLRHPAKFVDNDNANVTSASTCYDKLMHVMPPTPDDVSKLDERSEMELFVAVTNYFKTLLVACDVETEARFVEPLLRAPTFLAVHGESRTMRFAFKNSLDLKLNVTMNAHASASRQNPMFKFNAAAVVAVKSVTRPNLKFQAYDLHPASQEYLSSIVYETIGERMPSYKSKIGANVTFNLCHKPGTPVVYGLDRAKLAKLDPDVRLCHVTINDGFLTAWRNNMFYLRVTLYVNYFLWDKNNM